MKQQKFSFEGLLSLIRKLTWARFYQRCIYRIPYEITNIKTRFSKKSKHKTILFYPEKPRNCHVLYKICSILEYRTTKKPPKMFALAINYEVTTHRQKDKILEGLVKKYNVLNSNCSDISKEKVDLIFTKVFGYSLMINPLLWKGKCVIKSDDNAKHDGKIISCPINKAEDGYIYQRIINNQEGNIVQDIRVPIIKDNIPFVYLKYREVNDRFSNTNLRAEMVDVRKVLSDEEIKLILLFSKEIGLDYGELDILRDKDDGRLYIVDVNNTPSGPPNHLLREQQKVALRILANTFEKEYLISDKAYPKTERRSD